MAAHDGRQAHLTKSNEFPLGNGQGGGWRIASDLCAPEGIAAAHANVTTPAAISRSPNRHDTSNRDSARYGWAAPNRTAAYAGCWSHALCREFFVSAVAAYRLLEIGRAHV